MIVRSRRALRRLRGSKPSDAAPVNADLTARVEHLEDSVRSLEIALANVAEANRRWLSDLQGGIDDIRGALGPMGTALESQAEHLSDLNKWLTSTVLTVTEMSTVPVLPSPQLQASAVQGARLMDPTAMVARAQHVMQVMTWLAHDPSETTTVVSVIMPTRDRREYLERAIQSVLTQSHTRLELVVIDDGSIDSTPEFLAGLRDPRVKTLRTTGVGEPAARNVGLATVAGDIVAFLDDDNLMHPGWLHAVAWAFERWPDRQLLYGARLIEDAPAQDRQRSGAMPSLEFMPFDRRRLEQSNYIDMNTIAFRAGLPEARFDESLQSSTDWSLTLDLTARYEPLELPVISCLYGTYAPGRSGDMPVRMEASRRVRARVHKTRPMRIISHTARFPLLCETYIHEEMSALEANGAAIGFTAARERVPPVPITQPLWDDFDAAIQAHDPDLVFLYGATHAADQLPVLERYGRPFALRVHSLDFDVEAIRQLREHPLCAGIWAGPRQAAQLQGAHPLAPIFQSHQAMPEPGQPRDIVASVSAGLSNHNFPLLLDAMGGFQDLESHIVVGRSRGEEQAVADLEAAVCAMANGPRLHLDMPRADVFQLLSRTSVLLHTLRDGVNVGMPMSVVEGMRAGCCVVHADRDELHELTGPGWRPYRTADGIATHVREVFAGGPTIDAERRANRKFATERFCAPERGVTFHREISDALEQWRLRVG